jgi:hypothetical protein
MADPESTKELTFLEHLAPASQPTPPSVRYPGGAGLNNPRRFLFIARPAQDVLCVYNNIVIFAMLHGSIYRDTSVPARC